MSGVRCFVGLPLPRDAVAALVRACDEIRACAPRWCAQKWVAAENLHITLRFLGDLDESLLPVVARTLCEAVGEDPHLRMRFNGLRAVPGSRRASMMWAVFDDENGACAALASRVGSAAIAFGVPDENHRYTPHVTLVRARRPLSVDCSLEEIADAEGLGALSVSDPPVILFSSRLTSRGPVYSELASWGPRGE